MLLLHITYIKKESFLRGVHTEDEFGQLLDQTDLNYFT